MKYNAVLEAKQTESTPTEPCTLNEAKNWCRIELDISAENTLITELIKVARKQVEGFLNISLVDKTVTAILNNSLGGISLPYGPVKNIAEVKDADGTTLTLDTDYTISGEEFKVIKTPCYDWLKVTYTTGYNSIPENFKTAVLNQVAYLYENRGDSNEGLSNIVKLSLGAYRRVW